MTLASQLATLESTGLIRLAQAQPELEYLFRHALVQDAAYSSLVKQDRKQLHRSVGEALERMYPDRLDDLAPLLAQHFDEAGDGERALKYYTLAGDHAARQYANAEAAAHYARAIDLAKRAPQPESPPLRYQGEQGALQVDTQQLIHLYLSRGRALQHLGRYDEVLRHYAELETLADERGDRAIELAALMARATVHSTPTPMHDPAVGEQLSQQTLALARELGDRQAEAKSLWNLMLVHTFDGKPQQSIVYGEQSLAIARELGLREQLAFTLNDLGSGYALVGQLERALAALREAGELWQELGNLPMLADSRATSAMYLFYAGRLPEAIAAAEEALRLSRSIQNLWGQAFAWGMLGYASQELGLMGQAAQAWEESYRLGEPSGLVVARVYIAADLAWLYATLGAIDRGIELATQAADSSARIIPTWRPWPIAVLARLHLLEGNVEQAEALIQAGCVGTLPYHFNRLLRSGAAAVFLAQAELALARGDQVRAVSLMVDLAAYLRSIGAGTFLPDALYLRGKALLAQDRLDDAHAALVEAHAASEAIGSRRTLWPILMALSTIEAQRGNGIEAQSLRQQARALVEFIADHIGAPDPAASFDDAQDRGSGLDLRASFLNLPEVRNVMRET